MLKCSVIVPIYNAAGTLQKCIDSLLAQTCKDFELILVDDGSTDNSAAIIDEYARKDNRIVPIHKENGGVSSARNMGLEVAKGAYIAFSDADDEVSPDWLGYYAIDESCTYDFYLQGLKFVSFNGKEDIVSFEPYSGAGLDAVRKLVQKLMVSNSFVFTVHKLFKREILNQHKIRFDTTLHLCEDAVFVATYFNYVKSFKVVSGYGYTYYCPPSDKVYKSGLGAIAVPFISQLNRIFNKDLPYDIYKQQAMTVRSAAMYQLYVENRLPDKEVLRIYKQFFCKALRRERPLSARMVDWLIVNSRGLRPLSLPLLKLIHKFSAC